MIGSCNAWPEWLGDKRKSVVTREAIYGEGYGDTTRKLLIQYSFPHAWASEGEAGVQVGLRIFANRFCRAADAFSAK